MRNSTYHRSTGDAERAQQVEPSLRNLQALRFGDKSSQIKLALLISFALWFPALWMKAGSQSHPQQASAVQRTSQSCRTCHQAIFDNFAQTAHFHTSSLAQVQTMKGNFSEGHNVLHTRVQGTYFQMEKRADGFYQTAHDPLRSRTERVDLVIGSGRKGQTYLYWKNGLLFQLPASFLITPQAWMNSPGYEDGRVNFDRVITPRCLECHSAAFRLENTLTGVKYANDYELGISCQTCHGEGSRHAQYHTANPGEKMARHILNPASLSRERKLDNCALCHSGPREPKKPAFSYQPGEKLEAYFLPESVQNNLTPDVHGNQIALLRRSKCFLSNPAMSCSTCHNVHQSERDLTQLAQNCLNCHQADRCKMAGKVGSRMMEGCIDCHMPNQESNLIRINTPARKFAPAYRHHTIGIYPEIAKKVLQALQEK